MLPVVLTIAGSDPSGGAGIQADQRAIEKAGASARSVVTAITAQTREGVRSWEAVSLSTLEAQLDAALDDGAVLAIKSGMIPSPGAARVVGAALRRHGVRRYVCDPVLASSAGVALAAPGTTDEMREALFSIATVLTPNAREAEVLSGRTIATIEDASAAGHVLLGSARAPC
ncbi:MAG: hydroxymethylpyrimidine/phosphomethylpyrimidine kinase [Acidobacteriota bacterium]